MLQGLCQDCGNTAIGPQLSLARTHNKTYALQVDNVTFERQPIADHANQLAANVQGNLKRSLEALGVVRPHLHLLFIIIITVILIKIVSGVAARY